MRQLNASSKAEQMVTDVSPQLLTGAKSSANWLLRRVPSVPLLRSRVLRADFLISWVRISMAWG